MEDDEFEIVENNLRKQDDEYFDSYNQKERFEQDEELEFERLDDEEIAKIKAEKEAERKRFAYWYAQERYRDIGREMLAEQGYSYKK